MDICFGDLVKVNGWWEVAFKSDGKVVVVITPPYPRMDGSGFPGFRAVGISRVETHYSIAAVPGAIEALEAYERATQLAEVSNESPEALNEWIEASNDATTKVLTALRAIRGEESA